MSQHAMENVDHANPLELSNLRPHVTSSSVSGGSSASDAACVGGNTSSSTANSASEKLARILPTLLSSSAVSGGSSSEKTVEVRDMSGSGQLRDIATSRKVDLSAKQGKIGGAEKGAMDERDAVKDRKRRIRFLRGTAEVYIDSQMEHRFLVVEFKRCNVRLLVSCIVISVVAFINVAVSESAENVVPFSIGGALVVLVGVLEAMLMRKQRDLDRKKREKAKEEKHVEEELRQTNAEDSETANYLQILSGLGASPLATELNEPGSKNETRLKQPQTYGENQPLSHDERLQHFIAASHEGLCVVFCVVTMAVVGVFYKFIQYLCHNMFGSQAGVADTQCPTHLFQHWFFTQLIPLILGQPRFGLVCVCNIVSLVLIFTLVRFHNVSSVGGPFIIFFICTVFVAMISVLKYVDEKRNRARFEVQILLEEQVAELKQKAKVFNEFVRDVTPLHLRSRLRNPSRIVQVDHSREAVCLCLQIRNAVKYMRTMLPNQSGTMMGLFNGYCERQAGNYYLSLIRSVGDTSYFCANLFNEDVQDTDLAVLGAVEFIHLLSEATEGMQDFHVCGGIACGFLTGMPLGTSCIRYDLSGEALDASTTLAGDCPPKRSKLFAVTGERLSDNLVFDDIPSPQSFTNDAPPGMPSLLLPLDPSASGAFSSGSENITVFNASITTTATETVVVRGVRNSVKKEEADSATNDDTTSKSRSAKPRTVKEIEISVGDATADDLALPHKSSSEGSRFSSMDGRSQGQGPKLLSTRQHVARILKSNIEVPNDRLNSRIIATCCHLVVQFEDPEMEKAATLHPAAHYRLALIAASAFYAALLALVIAGVVESRHSDRIDGPLTAFYIVQSLCILCFVAISLLSKFTSMIRQPALQVALIVTCLVSHSVANLARPSYVANDIGFLTWIFYAGILYSSTSVRRTFAAFSMLIVSYYIFAFTFRVNIEEAALYCPALVIVMTNSLLVQTKLERQMFRNLVLASEAKEEVQLHDKIHKAVLSAMIPLEVQPRYTPERIQKGELQCWCRDDGVVIVLSVRSKQQINAITATNGGGTTTVQPVISPPPPQTGGLLYESLGSASQIFSTSGTSGGVGVGSPPAGGGVRQQSISSHNQSFASPSSVSQVGPEAMHRYAQETTGKIEAAVESLGKDRKLSIIRMFGGTVVIAGPLEGTTITDSMIAVEETMKLMAALLSDDKLTVRAGIGFEQIMSVARITEYPSYELLGNAMAIAKAINTAAPADMVMVTEKMAKLYSSECRQNSAVSIGAPTSWRLRDVGHMRVCRVQHNAQQLPATVSPTRSPASAGAALPSPSRPLESSIPTTMTTTSGSGHLSDNSAHHQ